MSAHQTAKSACLYAVAPPTPAPHTEAASSHPKPHISSFDPSHISNPEPSHVQHGTRARLHTEAASLNPKIV
jgi:hypothetical protein